jgi:hypothetical protein
MTTPEDILCRLPEAIRERAEKETKQAFDAVILSDGPTGVLRANAAVDAVLARYAAAADEADAAAIAAIRGVTGSDAASVFNAGKKAEDQARAAFWAQWEAQSKPVDRAAVEELVDVARDLAEVRAGQAGWGAAEARIVKTVSRLAAEVTARRADLKRAQDTIEDVRDDKIEAQQERDDARAKLESLREKLATVGQAIDAVEDECSAQKHKALCRAFSALLAEAEGEPVEVTTSYTRAQLAVAVDEAHTALHEWVDAAGAPTPGEVDAISRAHEALHRVGAGQERIACATPDPEAQRLYADIRAMGEREMPCGHKVENLVYGGPDLDGRPAVAQCGQCLTDRQAWKRAQPRTPESVLRAMLRAYEQAALDAARAWWRSEDPDDADAHLAYEHALQAWSDVLLGLTMCLEGDAPDADDFMHTDIGQDYAARLRGDRPVDAPPAEV